MDDPGSSCLQPAWLKILRELPQQSDAVNARLAAHDVHDLAQRTLHDRVGVIRVLKDTGVSRHADCQKIANALCRLRRRAMGIELEGGLQKITLVVVINVHELPSFILLHLRHVRAHLPPVSYRILLNCNAEMLAALKRTDAAELCHPEPLEKRRHHGSLLHGIVSNFELALQRFDAELFLVLSSRSWFRRPLTLDDLWKSDARSAMPPGKPCDLRLDKTTGLHWAEARDETELKTLADGRVVAMTYPDPLSTYRSSLLAQELEGAGHCLAHAPHEGLLLECEAVKHALSVLAGPVGADLFSFEAAVEEMALQSLARSKGLRFAQLSDQGRAKDGHGLGFDGAHLPPITKTVRFEAPENPDGVRELF